MSDQARPARTPLTAEALNGLLDRIRAGDQDAATDLFNRYAGFVRHRVRHSMRAMGVGIAACLLRRMTPDDVAQEAWLTFFERGVGSCERFPDERPFLAFLACLVFNKLRDARHYHVGAFMRDARREVPLEPITSKAG